MTAKDLIEKYEKMIEDLNNSYYSEVRKIIYKQIIFDLKKLDKEDDYEIPQLEGTREALNNIRI